MQGLRERLDEAEATLEAIRTGEIDALVVSGPEGIQTRALEGANHPFHILLNSMSDGAVLLARDGKILFANSRIGEIARTPLEALQGSRFQRLVEPGARARFASFLEECAERNDGQEFAIVGATPATPVWIALSTLPLGPPQTVKGSRNGNNPSVLMAIVRDLTERKQSEATRLGLMTRLISAEDEERRRIARELHDETGQSLSALLVGLRAIEEQAVTATVRSAAQRLRSVAAQTVDNVGRLARGLHPSVLDDLGLTAAARHHAKDYEESFGVRVHVRVANVISLRLPLLVQTTMYRILQEALTNVARHARAQVIDVELKHEGTVLQLVVRDDGVGFDSAAAIKQASGLGLHGMRERVALLGGSLEINSKRGYGTTLRARVPAGMTLPPRPRRGTGPSPGTPLIKWGR